LVFQPADLARAIVPPSVALDIGDGWDNPDRLTSEAAFAHLCGAASIPASSG
jgi:transposase